MFDRRMLRHYDYSLLGVVIVLLMGGVAMVFSATRGDPELTAYPFSQAITALIGLILVILLSVFDYKLLSSFTWLLYLIVIASLALVLPFGTTRYGATRWFTIGSLDLQPGEFAKVLLAVVIAKFVADRQGRRSYIETVFLSLLLIAPCVGLILAQPNLSTALTVLFVWAIIVFVGGIERQQVMVGTIAAVVVVFIILQFNLLQDYQLRRLQSLFDPASANIQQGDLYQPQQAAIALGSGGLWGQGYLRGPQSQLRYFPVRHTDFIFSVIGEELGFAGSLVFILMLIFVIVRALRAAMISRDLFGRLLCAGIASTLFLQTYINIGMQVGLLPVTGVVLPFISYGRSSLLVVMSSIGLIESVAMRHKKLEF